MKIKFQIIKYSPILFFLIISYQLSSQEKYPQSYFISPLDIPLHLSGTFGELRSDHFHSGIDIRTGEIEGLKVYAIADGYVSRIKVSSGGYGYALYITHKNGFVSVYGHLQQYLGSIKDYVLNEQYRRESFEVDLYPAKDLLEVKQGEVIALSGDSGGSGGPHLHFEIRDGATEKVINPLLFGFTVVDTSPPVINILMVYPADRSAIIRNKNKTSEFLVQGGNGKYSLAGKDTLAISGKVYFGINTIDLFNNGNNKNGVYSVKVMVDSNIFFQTEMKTFSFDETRYINSLLDYPERILNNRWIQKSYIQPNNHLSIYKNVQNRGIVNFNDENVHSIVYQVADATGNLSSLRYYVKSNFIAGDSSMVEKQLDEKRFFNYTTANTFEGEGVLLEVPGDALYDTLMFTYELLPAIKKSVSKIHRLHYQTTPIHTYCSLSIKPDSLPITLRNKALIAKIDDEKGIISAGGAWDEGFVKTQIREFGKYCIIVDTVSPKITGLNITNNKDISVQKTIQVQISDELSGIGYYRGTLNDKWILMEYDAKNDLLTYRYDERLAKGENNFKLTVTDKRSNVSVYRVKLFF